MNSLICNQQISSSSEIEELGMGTLRTLALAGLSSILGTTAAFSQSAACVAASKGTPARPYCELIDAVMAASPQDKPDAAAQLAVFYTRTQYLPAALQFSMLFGLFQRAQGLRTDKQTGAPASANGTTNLVSLPGATDFLSVAVGAGAVTETTSGTTTTIAGNLGQVLAYFANGPKFDFSLQSYSALQNIDVTLSIANFPGGSTSVPVTTSTGSSTSGNATVPSSSTSLTGATARYQLFNRYDPHSPQFRNAFRQYVIDHPDQINAVFKNEAAAEGTLVGAHFRTVAESIRDDATSKFERAPTLAELVDDFNAYFETILEEAKKDPKFDSDLANFAFAVQSSLNEYRQIVTAAKGVPALTFEYTYTNSPNQPVTHNARLITGLQSPGGWMFTLNGAGTFYQDPPSESKVGYFRDFQAAGQLDIPFGSASKNHNFDLSFAGYGQFQASPTLLSVSAADLPSGFPANAPALVAGTQGWLGIGQAKLTIRGASGVQFVPFSWRWSSREDVFKKSQAGFQFGLSYDLSSLSQIFGAQ